MLIGYIDDSGSAQSKLFTLSCIVGHTSTWMWIEWAWLECMERKNADLKSQARKELSRFHAADYSSRVGEFKGWTLAEQKVFMAELITILQRHPLGIIAYTIDLRDLTAEFPEACDNPHGLAHVIVLTHIVKYIGNVIQSNPRYRDEQIDLVHDRSDYDAVLLEAFNHVKRDEAFATRERFGTISAKGWEACVPLQLADFLAYENFKIIERESAGRPRRLSMQRILELESWGGRGAKLQRAGLRDIREKLSSESLRVLFSNARIRCAQGEA